MTNSIGIQFWVEGKPVTKQKLDPGHRLPARVKAWEANIKVHARSAMQHSPRFEKITGPVRCHLALVLPDRRKRDVDNLSKAVLDGCNGVLWEDDTQIIDLHLTKGYDKENPGVFISAWSMDDSEVDALQVIGVM